MLIGVWIVLLFFVGLPKRLAIALGILAVIISIVSWQFLFLDYQKARISAFMDPSIDPLGQGYNVRQAIIAVGAGGLFGRGLGFGSQSQLKFLPESQTDFIFAVIAEELGFLGVALLLTAFGLLFSRIYRHASNTRDDFTSLLMLGIVGLLLVQFIVNVGMNLGMLPVTGVGLPLVSYGGSSLVFMLLMLGIVESAILRSRRPLSSPERTGTASSVS
jgi:rod shape determining protein RodA